MNNGGGYEIKIDDANAWLIVNNGADGDDWSRSNVRGHNFIAYRCPVEAVQKQLKEYMEAKNE